jgi:hypothetical protein
VALHGGESGGGVGKLAESLGVSSRTLNNWTAGRRTPHDIIRKVINDGRAGSSAPQACRCPHSRLNEKQIEVTLYAICYVAIGIAVLETIYSNRLVRSGKKEEADRMDRRCRVGFPVALVVAVVGATIRAFILG